MICPKKNNNNQMARSRSFSLGAGTIVTAAAAAAVVVIVGTSNRTFLLVEGYSPIPWLYKRDSRKRSWIQQTAPTKKTTGDFRRHGFHETTTTITSSNIIMSSTLSGDITTIMTKNNTTTSNDTTIPVVWSDNLHTYQPLFDFSKSGTVDMIERLDDAIMGGISTSSVQQQVDVHNNGMPSYARWTGVCRTDGGGFCGFRTNPFAEPLVVDTNTVDGFYIKCRLSSDNEPQRRIWKFTTRSKPDRGELLYQAPFVFPNTTTATTSTTTATDHDENNTSMSSWYTIRIPFDTFCLVRGPRVIPNGPPLNASTGLYQIGMTMSQFIFNSNTSILENFRDGYFEVQIQEIGLYSTRNVHDNKSITASTSTVDSNSSIGIIRPPKVYTKDEAKKKQSILVKVLLPVSKLFFSEASNRRRSAMKILTQKRNMTRIQAIQFGIKSRSNSSGIVSALVHTMSILFIDTFRSILLTLLRISLLYPITAISRLINMIQGKPQPQKE